MKKKFLLMHEYLIILALIALTIFSHINWFRLSTTLTSGDWLYFHKETIKNLWQSWGSWLTLYDFGKPNLQISFYFFKLIWAILGQLGFSYDTATKVTFFIPIAVLGFISPYILFKKIYKNTFISFIVSLFYGTTTPFLIRQLNHLPIALVFASTPLIIYFFILSLESKKLSFWLIFTLLLSVSFYYENRMTFIVLQILFVYSLFNLKLLINNLKLIFISSLILIGLNSFWLLPTFLTNIFSSASGLKSQGLFGDWLFDLPHSISLFESSWTGRSPNVIFVKQPILWYFWLVPIFIMLTLFIKNNRMVSFFWVISIIGIFFTKQSVAPFPKLYYWIYQYIPGFGLFRESSKFYLMTSLGYAGLVGYALMHVKDFFNKLNMRFAFIITTCLLILLFLLNMKPLLTKEIRGLFISKNFPSDYQIIKKFILKQPYFFRTLWVPVNSRWSFFNDQHPIISGTSLNIIWNEKIKSGFLESLSILNYHFSDKLIDLASIKYVIVPLEDKKNDDNFFNLYGERKGFINNLNKLRFLKRINISTKEVIVFENSNFRPHFYLTYQIDTIYKNIPLTHINYYYINPAEYKIKLKNLTKPVYLNFSESYQSEWKIKTGKFNWFKSLIGKNYFISDKNHFKNEALLNSFYLDPKDICDYKTCSNVDLTVYFKPQSYFYLGIIISVTSFIFCLVYLFWLFYNRVSHEVRK